MRPANVFLIMELSNSRVYAVCFLQLFSHRSCYLSFFFFCEKIDKMYSLY